jgi:hypothetical protein
MVNIVDWEATSVIALRKLLDAIGRGGFDCVRVWGSTVDSETVECLADAGFVPASSDARARESFLLRPIADAGSTGWRIGGMQADSLESWGLRMIDSDAY